MTWTEKDGIHILSSEIDKVKLGRVFLTKGTPMGSSLCHAGIPRPYGSIKEAKKAVEEKVIRLARDIMGQRV